MKKIITSIFLIFMLFSMNASADSYRNNDTYYFEGPIDKKSILNVIETYDNKPFKKIVLTSYGGEFRPGMILAQFVYSERIAVYVPKYCASACTFAFFAAEDKNMSSTAYLALHNVSLQIITKEQRNYKFSAQETVDIAQEAVLNSGQMMALYARAGIPSDILFEVAKRYNNDAVKLTRKNLVQFNIIN